MRTGERRRRAYWRRNLTYVVVLLGIWFAVSYGFGILLADELDRVRLGGFKLGFWFAQQGSIYVFVALIFLYVYLMNRLDRTLLAPDAPAGDDDSDRDSSGESDGGRADRPSAARQEARP